MKKSQKSSKENNTVSADNTFLTEKANYFVIEGKKPLHPFKFYSRKQS